MNKIIGIIFSYIFLFTATATAELTADQKWALASTALVTERYQQSSELLGTQEPNEEVIILGRNILQSQWNVDSHETLLVELERLEYEGQRMLFKKAGEAIEKESYDPRWEKLFRREIPYSYDIVKIYHKELGAKSLLGWDYMRYIMLCRWGYLVGFLTEEEAWEKILPKAAELQQTFDSWEDLGKNYLVGLQFWPRYSKEFNMQNYHKFLVAYQRLLTNPNSIWNKMKWKKTSIEK